MTTCQYCQQPATLVDGTVIYPHQPDLAGKRFWLCAPCDAWIGCHPRSKRHGFNGTEALGTLANAELRKARMRAHAAFDPLWREGAMSRTAAYRWLAEQLGIELDNTHIGHFDIRQCDEVVTCCKALRRAA